MTRQITREYNYSDVYLVPNKCVVNSRSECDTSVVFGGRKFDVPVMPANMPAVINEYTCEFLAKKNIFYVMHRFDHDQVSFLRKMKSLELFTSISVGVNQESKDQIKRIKEEKLDPDYITIDVAHAWSEKTKIMIDFIKTNLPNSFLIVGNMACKNSVQEIEEWGADCCRVHIGPGKACTTKVMTGFTRPTVSCLLECVSTAKKPVIADGGIREIGDINKALACGATMVMVGSLFCGYNQSGSEIIEIDGHKKCVYFGNASEQAKKGKRIHVEGKKVIMDYNGDMEDFLIELKQSIQSGISYAGGTDLSAFMNTRIVAIN
jgi:GMP reductase